MIDYRGILKNKCRDFPVFTDPVLDDPKFSEWSGGGSETHHHYGDGGLIKHTYEVFEYAELIAMQHNSTCVGWENRINPTELFISVIWHDYGKIWDYQKVDGVWGKHNNHARQIHHISRSALEFNKHCLNILDEDFLDRKGNVDINPDNIIHNILSHHGQRAYGSPVAPATREAWILHLADNLSARLDDCNKHDIIKH